MTFHCRTEAFLLVFLASVAAAADHVVRPSAIGVVSNTRGNVLNVQLSDQPAGKQKPAVLGAHNSVRYSDPFLDTDFQSNTKFNARGMQHVYTITHMFLNLVQRSAVLPPSVNASEFFGSSSEGGGADVLMALDKNKEELMLQYIGVITVAICGLLAAVAVPIAGFCLCCCRCAGKCGGYPEHFDKRGDACKRPFLGVILSVFVIAAMFGVVSAFVTNQYSREGVSKLPQRMQYAAVDAGKYFGNTGKEVHSLLVTNFEELKTVLFKVLDDSGDILEKSLANAIQEATLDNLTETLEELGGVKSHLVTIQNRTLDLQEKVRQLDLGLRNSKSNLKSALQQCSGSAACKQFLRENNIDLDLNIAADFLEVPFELPDVSLLMSDISDLVKVSVRVDVERQIGDIRPAIKNEIKKMGVELSEKSAQIQNVLNEFDGSLQVIQTDIPRQQSHLDEYGGYLYYIGFGMSLMVLLVLICYVLGLFYGFCGNRPGNVYGDDCCNRGTGANWLLAAVYLTFMFSCVLLVVTTALFVVGSTLDKIGCKTVDDPVHSELFGILDEQFITPRLEDQIRMSSVEGASEIRTSMRQILDQCNKNETLYVVLQTYKVYDVDKLRDWKEEFGFNDVISDLSSRIVGADLGNLELLSPEAEDHLRKLAESKVADLDFSRYTDVFDAQVTRIDLDGFIRQLEGVKRQLGRSNPVRLALGNEVLFLRNMAQLVAEMKAAVADLKASTDALEKDVTINRADFRKAIQQVILQARKGPEFLQRKGPALISNLANAYIDEAVGLIDHYVERVVSKTKSSIGQCGPVSASFNATVDAVCREIVDPFNGLWASVGWCVVLYLASVAMALALVSLYRKSEPYPGPLVERGASHQHQDNERSSGPAHQSHSQGGRGGGKKSSRGKRGHRRNPSEYLPDSAHHYRAGYSYQASSGNSGDESAAAAAAASRFQDAAPRNQNSRPVTQISLGPTAGGAGSGVASDEQPPRYISNPNLVNLDAAPYERPPPYYYPGASAPPPPGGDVPPPLPPPNRT